MSNLSFPFPEWLIFFMEVHEVPLWGCADLRGFSTPRDSTGGAFPIAISFAIPVNPVIMTSIKKGPNQAYADEYARVNALINHLAGKLTAEIRDRGFRSHAVAASQRTDTVNITGDFPHKTAATRAGLGWIGRHCQLITLSFGSWIRLGTIFTDMSLPCGKPLERDFCGSCRLCVDACPAGALTGQVWKPGVSREDMLDVHACDIWKKTHYFQYNRGHNCGICSAVCPYGLNTAKKMKSKQLPDD